MMVIHLQWSVLHSFLSNAFLINVIQAVREKQNSRFMGNIDIMNSNWTYYRHKLVLLHFIIIS